MKKKTPLLIFAAASLIGGLVGCSEGIKDDSSSSQSSTSSSNPSSSSVAPSSTPSSSNPESSSIAPSSSSQSSTSSSNPSSSSVTPSSSSSEASSSSSEAPKHVHNYNNDHICSECGYSEPGALSVNLDGSLDDAKWAALDKTNSLFDLGEDGRGLKVKGFTDETLAYFAFEIISNTNAFANAEIIFNGDNSTQTTVTVGENGFTEWGDNFIGAVVKTTELEDGHYQTIVEIAANLSVVAPNGTLAAAFGAVISNEKSSSSYSDTQIEYWVLKGINPWGGAASAFNVTSNGIEHTHTYRNEKCIWCDAAIPAMAINPDGDSSDWDADIANKYIGTDDSEDRHFGWNAFTDENHLYITSTLVHMSRNVEKLNMLRLETGASDATEETVVSFSGTGYSFGGSGLITGGYKEALDEASGLTKTTFELVFLKNSWLVEEKINIGLLAWVPSSSDNSEHFNIDSTKPGYWGITSAHNAWLPGGRFEVTDEGVVHEHSYSKGKCILCGADDPNAGKTYDITVDGDFSDWNADVLATKVSDSDPAGPAISITGFTKNGNVYVAMEATHKESVYFTLVTKTGAEIWFAEKNGDMTIPKGGEYVMAYDFTNATDEETGYVTTKVEAVLSLEKLDVAELGYAVQAMGEETSSVLHYAGHGWTGHMWVIKQLNAFAYRFGFNENGLTHTHVYSDGKCKICGATEPEPANKPAITLDGSLDDFSEAAKNTKITNTATNSESISLMGFADDYYAYLGITVKTLSAGVSVVDMCGTNNANYVPCNVNNGVISTANANAKCASATRSYDEESQMYTYTFEIAVLKSAFDVETDGSVKIGVSVNDCNSNAELTCDSNNLAYWGINNLNAWWGVQYCFTFSAAGIAAPTKA